MRHLPGSIACMILSLLASRAYGQDTPPREREESRSHRVVRDGSVVIGGEPVDYRAIAGEMPLLNDEGAERARIFFVAYLRTDGEDATRRPITFAFNGGPGSSSVWLHLGAFGPRIVELDDEGFASPAPFALTDNEHSILDFTDLVFIDPVSTGFSRASGDAKAEDFHGVDQDIESVGEFILRFTTEFGRWLSPRFLAGESYGTTRAAGLARHLESRHGMGLNGVVLISAILQFITADTHPDNDLAFLLTFPTCTATAFYHRRLAPELQEDLRRTLGLCERFVLEEYSVGLLKGDALPPEERTRLAERIARFAGVSAEFVEQCDLRMTPGRFRKELLRDVGRTAGRLDTRFTGEDRDDAGERPEFDPSYANIQAPFTAALNHYVRRELGYEEDRTYEILGGNLSGWDYGRFENRYVDVAEDLRRAMTKNPHLRVFVASGYFDLATPYFAARHTFRHLGLDDAASRVRFADYPAGHMMYIQRSSRAKLREDLSEFYLSAVSARAPTAPSEEAGPGR